MSILPLSGIKGEGSPGGAESHLSSHSTALPSKNACLAFTLCSCKQNIWLSLPPGRGESRWSCPIYPLEALSPIKPRTALRLGTVLLRMTSNIYATSQNTINSLHLNGLPSQAR